MSARRCIHQLLPAAHVGDATGGAALHLAGAFRAAGYDARLWALSIDAPLRGTVASAARFQPPDEGDITLLHFALPSTLSDTLLQCPGRRVIVYHNLTPPELLAPFCPEIAHLTAAGRVQLQALAQSGRVDLAIGVSEFNRADLVEEGFTHTTTLPLPLDVSRLDQRPDPLLAAQLRDVPTLFLTVGRVAPNKRLEDYLKAAAYYLRYIDPRARFVIVGTSRGLESYAGALRQLHRDLDLDERVSFTGKVSHRQLIAWYRAASVYVCTSVHEGFCAPLVEAMHFELPILARRAAAIPETLGDAGLTYEDPDPATIAEALHLLATDTELRQRLAAAARKRRGRFAPELTTTRWIDALAQLSGNGQRTQAQDPPQA